MSDIRNEDIELSHQQISHHRHHYGHKRQGSQNKNRQSSPIPEDNQLSPDKHTHKRNKPMKVTKTKFKALEIHQEYRERVSAHLQSLPKFKTLDDIGWFAIPTYDNVVDQYVVQNTNLLTNPRLADKTSRSKFIENMRNVYGRRSILFSVDVEAWELDSNMITEIGIAIYDPRDQQMSMIPTFQQIHIRIKENIGKFNGRYVPDHANNFNGGTSYVMTLYEAGSFIQSLVDYYFLKPREEITSYLVGHDLQGDMTWLRTLGVKIPADLKTLDTVKLLAITQGKRGTSLGNALNMVQIPHAFLHNAGNDAYYTLLLAMTLCDPQCRVKFNLDKLRYPEEPTLSKEEKLARKELKRQKRMQAKANAENKIEENNDSSNELASSIEEVHLSPKNSPAPTADEEKKATKEKAKKKSKRQWKTNSNIAESIEIVTAMDASLKIFEH